MIIWSLPSPCCQRWQNHCERGQIQLSLGRPSDIKHFGCSDLEVTCQYPATTKLGCHLTRQFPFCSHYGLRSANLHVSFPPLFFDQHLSCRFVHHILRLKYSRLPPFSNFYFKFVRLQCWRARFYRPHECFRPVNYCKPGKQIGPRTARTSRAKKLGLPSRQCWNRRMMLTCMSF